MTILVVEDDLDISQLLKRGFEMEGYLVECITNGEEAIQRARSTAFESIILDVMLPGCSGLDVCKEIRKTRPDASIIMLSARDTVPDRIEGLSAGADDYVVKPFSFDELLARVRVQAQKKEITSDEADSKASVLDPIKFNNALRKLEYETRSVVLTEREADLLILFMDNAGKPLSREEIFTALWASQGGNALNVVDVYVGYLRRKISSLGVNAKSFIKTVRGSGFVLDPE